MELWVFKSRAGTFKISQLSSGRTGLWVDNELLGSYHSPHSAAQEVFECTTGHEPWDENIEVDFPSELDDWRKIQ